MRSSICFICALAMVLGNVSARAADVLRLGVTKVEDYKQEEDRSPVLNSPGAFWFFTSLRMAYPNAVLSASFTAPEDFTAPLASAGEPQRLEYVDYYDNPIALNLNYPAGIYRIDLVGAKDGKRSVTFDLPENFYPNTPRISNWSDAQRVYADKPFELRWEPFAEGTTNDLIQLVISDLDGNEVFSTPTPNEAPNPLDGTVKSLTLPAHLLKHGTRYQAALIFGRIIERDLKQYPGALALTMFARQTVFPIVTAGTEDIEKLTFQLSFTYLAYGGDFHQKSTVEPAFPLQLDDCYVARLFVRNEEFVPIADEVTFSSPAGTALTNLASEYRYTQDDGVFFETPCLDEPTKTMPGTWTIGYANYPIAFKVPDARPVERLVLPLATVTLEGDVLRKMDWTYYDNQGTRLRGTPAFITNQVVELYNEANFPIATSANLPGALNSFSPSSRVEWSKVRRVLIAYQDNLGNWYGVSLDHSPPPGLSIANELLPLGSIATPYLAQMIATNGTPPYVWTLDGNLPPGLKLDRTTGVISGTPLSRGSYRFGMRVDDAKLKWEYDSYFIRITTNGPPVIYNQPDGGDVEIGDYAYFEVEAEGTQPLGYQWLFNGKPIAGETNEWLLLLNVSSAAAGNYAVRISNAAGVTTSADAPMSVLQPPVIVAQPASQEVQPGTNVTFRVEVRSAPPIFYQWRRNGEVIEGATNSTYAILNAQPRDSGTYSVLVLGAEGFVQSEDAMLTFQISSIPFNNRFANRVALTGAAGLGRGSNQGANRDPGEPVHANIPGGSSVWAIWTAPADGIATFSTSGSDFDTVLAVYTGDVLSQLVEIASDDDGEEYYASVVRFNARAGQQYQIAIDGVYGEQGEILLNWSLDTSGSRLPEILRQPVDAIVLAGGTAVFTMQATNPPPAVGPVLYQWYFNGLEMPGETNATLVVPNVNDARLGIYLAAAMNETEFVLSDLVVIEVSTDPDVVARRVSTEDKFANLSQQTNGLLALDFNGRLVTPLGSGGSVARGYTGSQVFSTMSSTTESGEPNHCGVVGGASQWYSYLAAASGFLVIDTDGSDFDTVMSVYTGSGFDFASLKQVACDNDGGRDGKDSRVGFQAVAGTLYLIAVDGVQGAKGTVRLNYNLSFPPNLQVTRGGSQVQLKLNGSPNGVFTIESSFNLRDWTTLVTTNSPTGVVQISSRGLGTAFYRGYQVN